MISAEKARELRVRAENKNYLFHDDILKICEKEINDSIKNYFGRQIHVVIAQKNTSLKTVKRVRKTLRKLGYSNVKVTSSSKGLNYYIDFEY